MATEVKLPELGDGIESGDVLEIFVSVGDVISAGQDIIEMETDKATVPVPASTRRQGHQDSGERRRHGPDRWSDPGSRSCRAGSETAAPPAAPAPEAAKPQPPAAPAVRTSSARASGTGSTGTPTRSGGRSLLLPLRQRLPPDRQR